MNSTTTAMATALAVVILSSRTYSDGDSDISPFHVTPIAPSSGGAEDGGFRPGGDDDDADEGAGCCCASPSSSEIDARQ